MPKILHVSDLHFGAPYVPKAGEALLEAAHALNPDVIVVSGDFTQRAKRHEFEEARRYIDQFPDVPMLLIPGNHDVPLWRVGERILKPLDLYCELICEDLNPVLSLESLILVGIDSTSPRGAVTNGRIHLNQLDHCKEMFTGVPPEAVRIVVAHHHFAPGPDRLYDRSMPKSRRAIECFVEQGVELILGGHLHRSYIGNSLDFYPGTHRDRGIIIVQCGTSTSSRGRGRERNENTFNVVDVGAQLITVNHYLYFEKEGEFAPVSQHLFPRKGRPFDPAELVTSKPFPPIES